MYQMTKAQHARYMRSGGMKKSNVIDHHWHDALKGVHRPEYRPIQVNGVWLVETDKMRQVTVSDTVSKQATRVDSVTHDPACADDLLYSKCGVGMPPADTAALGWTASTIASSSSHRDARAPHGTRDDEQDNDSSSGSGDSSSSDSSSSGDGTVSAAPGAKPAMKGIFRARR